MDPESIALDAKSAASLLRVSESFFHHVLRKRPDFPPSRSYGGRRVFWSRAELVDWFNGQQALNPASEPDQLRRGRIYRSGRLVEPRS